MGSSSCAHSANQSRNATSAGLRPHQIISATVLNTLTPENDQSTRRDILLHQVIWQKRGAEPMKGGVKRIVGEIKLLEPRWHVQRDFGMTRGKVREARHQPPHPKTGQDGQAERSADRVALQPEGGVCDLLQCFADIGGKTLRSGVRRNRFPSRAIRVCPVCRSSA